MFRIDPTANGISPLQAKRFSDLGFSERKHLQEWLENTPRALAQGDGDELLIIQKEFDGFIEACLGHELDWLPLPNKKACRIQYAKAVEGYDKVNWPDIIHWMIEHMTKLEGALSNHLKAINQQLKQTSFDAVEVSGD